MTDFGIGKSVHRPNDVDLLTGQGRFTDDVSISDELQAYVLRSPHAHARILSLCTADARAAPGVHLILTAADYREEGLGVLPYNYPLAPGWDLDGIHNPQRVPLAEEVVRCVGDGVALIVAETLDQAKDAAERIDVDYQPLEAVVSTSKANAPDAAQVWDDCPGNLIFDHEKGDKQAADAAFASADHIARAKLVISRVAPSPIEGRSVIANFDPNSGVHTIHTGAQSAFKVRRILAQDIFKEAEDRFHVIVDDVGGSFGLKGAFYPEHALTVWAARRLARPVRWNCDRGEGFQADFHGRDNISETELALDKNGKFLAVRVTITANLGAYPSNFPAGPATSHVGGIAGVYTIPAAHVRVLGVYTHTSTIGSYRGAGRPEASYVIERIIDIAAKEMGLDRAEIRRRNMIPPEALPYKTPFFFKYEDEPFGFFEYDSGDFPAVLDEALVAADYAGFEARRAEASGRDRLRGLGIAYIIEMAASPGFEFVELAVDASGRVTVHAGTSDCGQGHQAMYVQVACEMLGVIPSDVVIVQGDTDRVRNGSGTSSSRSTSMGGSALRLAAEKIIEQGRGAASTLLSCAESEVVFSNGMFLCSGTNQSVSLADVAAAIDQAGTLYRASGTHRSLAPNWPNGCHVCEVEIDPETGVVELAGYAVVEDVGTVMNPMLLAGQVHGGVAQGVGQALFENVSYDESSGQLLSGSFLDYALPRAADMTNIQISHHPVPTETNPLGTKGGGESGTIGSLPCVMNAVVDALAPLGVKDLDMPATPEKVWAEIQNAQPGMTAHG